jgi:hypothetical protein
LCYDIHTNSYPMAVRDSDNLTAICELIVWKMWEPQHLKMLWASTACYRYSF